MVVYQRPKYTNSDRLKLMREHLSRFPTESDKTHVQRLQPRLRQARSAQNLALMLSIFMVLPLVALILAVKRFPNRDSLPIFVMFFVWTGFTFIVTEGPDAARNRDVVEFFANAPFSVLWEEITSAAVAQGTYGVELFRQVTAYVVGTFVWPDFRPVFALWALVYALVFIYFLRELSTKRPQGLNGLLFWLALIGFLFYVPATEAINGRFWLGYWIWIFATYKVVFKQENKYLFYLLLTPLVHQGLAIAALITSVFPLIGRYLNWRLIGTILLPLAIGIGWSGLGPIASLAEFVGGTAGQKAESYLSGAALDPDSTSFWPAGIEGLWFLVWHHTVIFYAALLSVLTIRLKVGQASKNCEQFLSFIALFALATITLQGIPSVEGRYFKMLTGLLLLGLTIYVHEKKQIRALFVSIVFGSALAFYTVVNVRIWTEAWNVAALVTGPLLYPFADIEFPIRDLFQLLGL